MKYFQILVCCSLLLSGCVSHTIVPSTVVNIAPPIMNPDEIHEVSVGDVIYEEGTYNKVRALEMSNSIDSTMPGAFALPFGFSIQRTILKAHHQTPERIYYAAPYEDIMASHTLLGSVIVPGDTVGVYIVKKTGKMRWYVDNTVYNQKGAGFGSSTIWSRRVKEEDNVILTEIEFKEYPSHRPFKTLRFGGIDDDNLLFVYSEISSKREKEREYRFHMNPDGRKISLKGKSFYVFKASDSTLEYKWIQ